MAEKIGENIGHFVLPWVATYVVRDQVDKWGARWGAFVVEDIAEHRLKIRFVYSIKETVVTPAFVEVVDIKVHLDIFVLVKVNKTSMRCGTQCIGLVITTTKFDTHLCGKTNNYGFMWLLGNNKFPIDVHERFQSMSTNVNTTITSP